MTDTYLKDEQANEVVQRRENRDGGWWIWALLLPIFFIGGWMLNDWWRINEVATQTQYGIGGAPADRSLDASPMIQSPLATDPTPSPINEAEMFTSPLPSSLD